MAAVQPPSLSPGDVLLYRGSGPASLAIRLATASRYTHVEMYDGLGRSWASRDGLGVASYPTREDGLALVLRVRPGVPFDIAAARRWWVSVTGQPYDWPGLLVSRFPALQGREREDRAQFCSEAMTRALRHGIGAACRPPVMFGLRGELADRGFDPFNGENADGIYPGAFAWCPLLFVAWKG